MTHDDVGAGGVLAPGEGKTVSLSGNRVTFVHSQSDAAYSVVEWAAAPGSPGTPPQLPPLGGAERIRGYRRTTRK